MDSTAIETTRGQLVRQEALTWPQRARAVAVTNDGTYVDATDLLKGIKALRTKIGEIFDPHIRRAYDAHKALVRQKAEAESPLSEAEGIIKHALVGYTEAQEHKRRAEEARLREEARQREEERRLNEAAALERNAVDTGDPLALAQAQELMEQPIDVPVIVLPTATPKVAGISYRDVWKFRVVNATVLPREYLIADETKIGGVVRALKGATKIPGIEVYCEKVAASASGASAWK